MSVRDDEQQATPLPRPRDQDIAHIVEEYVADAVLIAGPQSRIIFWNRAAERMFGYSRAEALGRELGDIIAPAGARKRTRSGLEDFVGEQAHGTDDGVARVTATRKDGRAFPVELAVSSVEVEGQRCVVALVRDVTRRAELEEELHRLATTCPLTELLNRREFFARANQEIVRSWRTKSETSVFMMDLDDFKRLNDRHGHLAGDAALKAFALTLKNELRATDLVGRVGGEEFAAVLPDTPEQPAAEVAERLRIRVAEMRLPADTGLVELSVSIGVTQHLRGQESLEDTLRRADAALYRAKRAGRNRVWVYTDED